MASDSGGEGHLNVLGTPARSDASSVADSTSALRDRLRLRLTVRNVVPGASASADETAEPGSGQMEWSSVLDSLSTRLHPEKRPNDGSIPAPTAVTVPVPTTVPLQPSTPQPFAPQPLSVPTRANPGPANPNRTSGLREMPTARAVDPHVLYTPTPLPPPPPGWGEAAGRQIYVPAGVGETSAAYGNRAWPPNESPMVSSYMSAPQAVAGAVGGMGVPYLGQPTRVPSAQRVVSSRFVDTMQAPAPTPRRSSRHPIRTLLSTLVVVSLLGGAAFTGWFFLIKNKVVWAADVEPLAAFVEQQTHAKFTSNVPVETLTAPEYEVKLGIDVLSRSYVDASGDFGTMQAVGVVSQAPAPGEVGHLAAAVMTAYYKPEKQTIYRLDGNTPLFDLAMLRALSAALADQRTGWFRDSALVSDAQRVGIRATVDRVGSYVVASKMRLDPQVGSLAEVELTARTDAVGITADTRPTYVNAALGSYLFGAASSPTTDPARPLRGVFVPTSDAVLFDPARGATEPVATVAPPGAATAEAPLRTLGMQFWYLVMLPVVGPGYARAGALNWIGDSSLTSQVEGRSCLSANIATANEVDQALLTDLLTRWATSRPASSGATVTPAAGGLINVSVCEPAEPTIQSVGPSDGTLLYSAALQESSVGYDLIRLGLARTQQAWTCSIGLVRNGAVPGYVTGSTDAVQLAEMSAILSQCPAA